MSIKHSQFNSLIVLSTLESECRKLAGKGALADAVIKDSPLSKGRKLAKAFKQVALLALRKLRNPKASMEELLEAKAGDLLNFETQLNANIELLIEGRGRYQSRTPRIWPEPLAHSRVVGRLVATVLGLHAGNRAHPDDPLRDFRICVRRGAQRVVLPALAWQILCEIAEHHRDDHPALLAGALRCLSESLLGQAEHNVALDGRTVTLRSLLLAQAWRRTLVSDDIHANLPPEDAHQLLHVELAKLLDHGDIDTARQALFPHLIEAFGWGMQGGDRARAIELAREGGKTIVSSASSRVLLDAAHSSEMRSFAEACRSALGQASTEASKALEKPSSLSPQMAAGMAYWLARACFMRPAGHTFSKAANNNQNGVETKPESERIAGLAPSQSTMELDSAANRACELLVYLANHKELSGEQLLLARRMLAGFATNPRYWRTAKVLSIAAKAIEAYAKTPGSNPALVAHFNGRLLWHRMSRSHKPAPGELDQVVDRYEEALKDAGDNLEGLDAETPMHLFPEIAVLLSDARKNGRVIKTTSEPLQAIDFILSRDFGIYMDIDSEREAIEAGLAQAAIFEDPLGPRQTKVLAGSR